jgi:hypothetical protein
MTAALAGRLGFDTVDAGGLAESWRFEPDTAAYLTLYASPELKRLQDLRSTPAAPIGAEGVRRPLARAERTTWVPQM